ncbi:CoA ester lyase [Malaciobacter molluscorum LMG 25693]|uniref:CoA ester lyase n=1 Tax=Malaciobacter molluscorum LMG 25693 TaxID=870501 RepID=A0A2G1DIA4_9BACT|nr:aldolase/citrate lyase family protein [Malaciobacter molluscorum]AXX92331.1 putative CoA ester lyase [Malaciobacter molluscorum LMG 25693]PHO18217.1 CoA ester lyase [Malaciobacter molluscorum LMG 25693]RXJ94006.1 CoA ester lyase [Malaciobacter molluscorum]
MTHPNKALFESGKSLPIIPSCEHFAGSEKLILKAFEMQKKLGPVFDITCDCEDGAETGKEVEHANMIVRVVNSDANPYSMAGTRIHDFSHPDWRQDIDILVPGAGEKLAYITLPKSTSYDDVKTQVEYIQKVAKEAGITKEIPIHILIETHGALQDVEKIATLPWLQVLDFGLMDFVSGYQGAIPASNMRSPGQFTHRLIAAAKTRVCQAAIQNHVIPCHNVTLDLKNPYQTFKDAEIARNEFGFMRMWSIYPTQIQAIVDAMKPDFTELEAAQNILLKAQDAEWGPIQYDGELHDRATYRYFWELVQRGHFSGQKLQEEVTKRFFS